MAEGHEPGDRAALRAFPATRPAYTRDSAVVRLAGIGVTGLDGVTPEWAWGGATGAGVRVAVVDSGVDAGHPALEGCVEVDDGVMVSTGDGGGAVESPGPHGDDFGHGTACAGIIHSLAPEARIVSVKVLGPGLRGRGAAFLRGLAWAIEQGVEVVNLSLGTTRPDWALALYELCDRAYFRNCVVVTAASNVLRPSFPSLYGSVVSVACNLSRDPWRFHYNPEPPTEFLARGIDVEVPWAGGGTMRATGNSYAAPHVSGIVALVRSKHPGLLPFQVKTVLWATSANVREAPRRPGRLTRSRAPVTSSWATEALDPPPPPPPGGHGNPVSPGGHGGHGGHGP